VGKVRGHRFNPTVSTNVYYSGCIDSTIEKRLKLNALLENVVMNLPKIWYENSLFLSELSSW